MYNILFVCSGNKNGGPGVVVSNQRESLVKAGLSIEYYLINGNGILGYYKNINILRKTIKVNKYNLIHAHGISALVATLTLKKPLVVSLLGSEINESKTKKKIFRILSNYYWSHTIVKSCDMAHKLNIINTSQLSIIPNGVNVDLFNNYNKTTAKKLLGWDNTDQINVLFLADKTRTSKNFNLAKQAFNYISNPNINLIQIDNISKEKVPIYLNAADVILLTSLWEGSPNIIKEAMACNTPIVATNVGDVKWLFGNEPGHFITGFSPKEVATDIHKAIDFSQNIGKTNGRKRIFELGLDATSVANKIIEIYKSIISNGK